MNEDLKTKHVIKAKQTVNIKGGYYQTEKLFEDWHAFYQYMNDIYYDYFIFTKENEELKFNLSNITHCMFEKKQTLLHLISNYDEKCTCFAYPVELIYS